jgi:hypothetical protein
MSQFALLNFLLLITCVTAQFELQFLGDYVSMNEIEKRYFCETKFCVEDAHDLFYSATQNVSVKPCDDFKEFALGTFIKYRAVSERDLFNGFSSDVQKNFNERQRKVLAAKVDEEKDSRVVKIMKNFFKKCVTSRFVRQNGVREMREYLKTFGLSFYPETDQSQFNIKKVFEEHPVLALTVFLRFGFCKDQNVDEMEVLCLRYRSWPLPALRFQGYQDMFYEMFEVYRNSSVEKYKEEFKEISDRMLKFYKHQETSKV